MYISNIRLIGLYLEQTFLWKENKHRWICVQAIDNSIVLEPRTCHRFLSLITSEIMKQRWNSGASSQKKKNDTCFSQPLNRRLLVHTGLCIKQPHKAQAVAEHTLIKNAWCYYWLKLQFVCSLGKGEKSQKSGFEDFNKELEQTVNPFSTWNHM